jgi:Holliday junction resolvasome RuvABC endonuclease subunit
VKLTGLDPGFSLTRSCALATLTLDGPRIVGVSVRSIARARGASRGDTLSEIRQALTEEDPDLLVVEDQTGPAVGAQARGQWGAGNLGVILVQGLAHGIGCPVLELAATTIKARVAGAGNAAKGTVEAAVRMRLRRAGIDLPERLTSHQADAIAIALAGEPAARLGGLAQRAKTRTRQGSTSEASETGDQRPRVEGRSADTVSTGFDRTRGARA